MEPPLQVNTYYRDITFNADIQESSKTVVVGVCGEVNPALGEILLEDTFGHIAVNKKFRAFDTLHSKVGVRIRKDFEKNYIDNSISREKNKLH